MDLRGTTPEVVAALSAWVEGTDDEPLVVETSGSTGRPKRVVLPRASVLASVRATARRLGGALALGLVQAPEWGWGSGRATLAWIVTLVAFGGFLLSSRQHSVPIIDPALLRVRAFAWSNVTALVFAVPFAAALLTNILWMQQVWGYSAIRTGFAIAPGPLMVPIFAAVAHRLSARVPIGVLVSLGCLLVGAGAVTSSLSVGPVPDYAADLLPGWLIGGVGVGLALPAILSSATADLPAARAATGSAVVNMNRQIGTVLGVSLVVAVLGSPIGYDAAHRVFQHTWWLLAAVAVLGAICAPGMTPQRAAKESVPAPADPAVVVS